MAVVEIRRLEPNLHGSLVQFLRAEGMNRLAEAIEMQHTPWDVYLAIDGSDVVGMLEGHFDATYHERFAPQEHPPPQAWVFQIITAKHRRRERIGSLLLTKFLLDGKRCGRSFVAMLVDQSSDTSERLAFFRSCGLQSLLPPGEEDVVGGTIADVLRALGGGLNVPGSGDEDQ